MPADEPARETNRPGAGSSRQLPGALLIVAAVLLVARIGAGIYEGRHPAAARDLVDWRPIVGSDSLARASGKPILYDFTADWCAPCRAMKQEVFGNEKKARKINALFIPVRVLDRSREEGKNPIEVQRLQEQYRITGFPTLVVVPAEGGDPVVLDGYGNGDADGTMQRLTEATMKIKLEAFHRRGLNVPSPSRVDRAGH